MKSLFGSQSSAPVWPPSPMRNTSGGESTDDATCTLPNRPTLTVRLEVQAAWVAVQRSSEFAPVPVPLDTTSCPIGPERPSEALMCRWTSSNVVVHGFELVHAVPAMLPSFCTTRTPIGTEAPDATGMATPVFHIPSAGSRVIE